MNKGAPKGDFWGTTGVRVVRCFFSMVLYSSDHEISKNASYIIKNNIVKNLNKTSLKGIKGLRSRKCDLRCCFNIELFPLSMRFPK